MVAALPRCGELVAAAYHARAATRQARPISAVIALQLAICGWFRVFLTLLDLAAKILAPKVLAPKVGRGREESAGGQGLSSVERRLRRRCKHALSNHILPRHAPRRS